MRRAILSLLTAFIVIYTPFVQANALVGKWTTIDDKTGKKRAVVQLSIQDGELQGTIVKVYRQKGDQGICTKCPGQFKNKPVEGLTFLWGLKKNGKNSWAGGHILDPKTGKTYHAKLSMQGNKLYVRGYVGLSMLGRTQVWVR